MTSHRRGKCYKRGTLSVQVIVKLSGNGHKNGAKDNAILDFSVYTYSLNKRTKFINKDSPIGRLFPPLPRYGEQFLDNRTQPTIINYVLSSDVKIFFNFQKPFPLKYCSNKSRKLLESFKKTELKLLGRQAQNIQYNKFKKKWLDLLVCCFHKSI